MKFQKRLAVIGGVLLLLGAQTVFAAEAVSWNGREWDGSISGTVGERNCDIVSVNRESARTDSVPYEDLEQARKGAVEYQKELSPWFLLLSQTDWRFSFYENPESFADSGDADFYRQNFDDSSWDSIFVPSVWQTKGYDHPIYTNTTQKFARNFGNDDIGFPRDLPRAPEVYNPVGLYRYSFEIPGEWEGRRIYLDFEGVDAAFYVWMNGEQVGYGEDSFTTDEFDITDYVRVGEENLIAVQVLRWCDGSWLEDQDFFDLSGIFRDVYVYATPQVRVRDFSVITDFDESYQDALLQVEVMMHNYTDEEAEGQVMLHLLDGEGTEILLPEQQGSHRIAPGQEYCLQFTVPVTSPRKWSAEDPYLYTLVLEEQTAYGTVYESAQIGFRKITYKTTASGWFEGSTDDQDLIRINGEPICFRGVDRHETHPEYGYALPKEVMEEDIRILLENNINAVRTSHYPNSPYWYYLCDKYGIYVVDEANLECHSNMIYENERLTQYLSTAIIDREYNMVRRDRNHACVVMWSLGNECKNPDILRTILVQSYPDPEGTDRVLHAYTRDRPWHYEQAGEMYETGIDVYSGMYERPEALAAHGESDVPAPMIECEYEHAMGNSEGNFDEYWEAYDTYRNLQGGFIWDMIDQSIYAQSEDGTIYFGYGGDFGEKIHDDNFCANGLLLPDRTLQPEMAEVRYHYQQVKFADAGVQQGLVEIKNYMLFTDPADKYDLFWSLQKEDVMIAEGVLDQEALRIPCVDPVSNQPGSKIVQIPLPEMTDAAEYFLNLSLRLREAEKMLPAGFTVAREQFLLQGEGYEEDRSVQAASAVDWQQEGGIVTVRTDSLQVTFEESSGRMTSLQAYDNESSQWRDLLVPGEGPKGDFFRGQTDNDRAYGGGQGIYIQMWKHPGAFEVTDFTVQAGDAGELQVAVRGHYPELNGLELQMNYAILPEGKIDIQVTITPAYNETFVYIPVAGVSMQVPEGLERLTWFGYGPEETYQDRYKGTAIGRWQSTVTENFFPYIQSSETGNHVGTRWLSLTDEEGFGLLVQAETEPFEFSVLHYTAEELDRAVHPYELQALKESVLRINAVQFGVGGDDAWARLVTHPQYLPHEEQYQYRFSLAPVTP